MSDLDLLRAFRTDVAPPTQAVLDDVRHALVNRAVAPAPRRRPRLRLALVTGTAVALILGGVAVHDATAPRTPLPSGPVPAPVTAADRLILAAALAASDADPVPGPGQYRLVRTHGWNEVGTTRDDGSLLTYRREFTTETWIPADDSHVWYLRHTFGPGTRFDSPADERYVTANRPPENGSTVLQGPGGMFDENSAPPAPGWDRPTGPWLAALPRAPRALLDLTLARVGPGVVKGTSPDSRALGQLASLLDTGLVPADLRATFFRAAALLTDVRVTENQAGLDGRTGVAVGVPPAGDLRQEFLFDPASGEYLGQRRVRVADGTVYASQATTVTLSGAPGF
ncbi:CU044_5270 family protein [Longispora sp. NPDC051575]|uniref:CU044_5270 family protein n=1 Tax=Longispora sp. NPDC051575 TaxID=3154943 RepID=UPI0034225FE0